MSRQARRRSKKKEAETSGFGSTERWENIPHRKVYYVDERK